MPTITKGLYSQNYGFPSSMYICESWTIKNTEHWRIDAFKLWCWRRLLGVPWTAKGSNQSILKEINPEYSLERLMLKLYLMLILATWCKQPTHWENPESGGWSKQCRWPSPPPPPLHMYTEIYCWFIPTYLVAYSMGEMMKGKTGFQVNSRTRWAP